METNKLTSCYVEFSSHRSLYNVHGEKKWCGAARNRNDETVVDLDIKFTIGNANEFIQARDNFVDIFLSLHGSRLQKLCFSACSKLLRLMLKWNECIQCFYTIRSLENNLLRYCSNLYYLELSWMDLGQEKYTIQQ